MCQYQVCGLTMHQLRFFACLDVGLDDDPCLRITVDIDGKGLVSEVLSIGSDYAIEEALEKTFEDVHKDKNYADWMKTIAATLAPLVDLLLYLCIEVPEIDE